LSAGRGVWQVLVIGSQNCPFTQLSGSAEPIPALKSEAAAMGAAATAAMVERRRRFRMSGSCPRTKALKLSANRPLRKSSEIATCRNVGADPRACTRKRPSSPTTANGIPVFLSEDSKEGQRAFREKRMPVWTLK
jgi:hypothetical protein